MARRILSLWLPRLAADRLARRKPGQEGRPFAVVAGGHGRAVVVGVDALAESAGIVPGMALADARAVEPGLRAVEAEPAADARALDGIADWCGRYTPWVGLDGADGLLLDVTGCAHLFGGESGLLRDLAGRLDRFGYDCRPAIADTPAAAAALARFGDRFGEIVPPGGGRAALAPLPAAALRLPGETVAALARFGLHRIGDLYAMPRPGLASRLGSAVVRRLDQALGLVAEPVSPRRPVPPHSVRLAFAEPISAPASIEAALRRLAGGLCVGLERTGRGARRLELACFRTDGRVERAEVGTSRPSRDPRHLARLFAERLGRLDPGPGIEVMGLLAEAEPLGTAQLAFGGQEGGPPDLAELVDRLGSRFGFDNVLRLAPRASWWPERMAEPVPALSGVGPASWPADRPRPLRLLPRAEPIEAIAPVPDDPPAMFRWRDRLHRIRRADGPERIEPEWWRELCEPRDYYRVEDEEGCRYWVYRTGLYRWFLHGVFG